MLRVISYNIHSGKDLFWRNRLNEMADVLAHSEADIIGLQEVHQNSRIGYQASYLAERLQYVYAFAPSLVITDGGFGNALLTKLPLNSSQLIHLPAKREPRTVLQTSLRAFNQEICVMVTHCSLDKSSRQSQTNHIRDLVSQKKDTPLLLLGDFNSSLATFHPTLVDCAIETHHAKRSTLVPLQKRLDYIFISGHWVIRNYTVLSAKCSDHYPLLATLELPELPAPVK